MNFIRSIIHRIQFYLKLPREYHELVEEKKQLTKLVNESTQLNQKTANANQRLDDRIASLATTVDRIQRTKPVRASGSDSSDSDLFADDHSLDEFYVAFEDKFRGSELEISKRFTKDYTELFEKTLPKDSKVLDIGSGRGEFLGLMTKLGIEAYGVDINEEMVRRSTKTGYEVVHGDAIEHMANLKPNSLGAVAGFHIAEHVPFRDLFGLMIEAYRAVKPGGFLLLETPNPENLSVGSTTFYHDPSHLNPIPPGLMKFAYEQAGFEEVEILRFRPVKKAALGAKPKKDNEKLAEWMMFGATDYAVVGRKKGKK